VITVEVRNSTPTAWQLGDQLVRPEQNNMESFEIIRKSTYS